MIEHLTKDSFKQKVFDYQNKEAYEFKGKHPVLVDFYATWCGPCKAIAPILDELQEEYKDKIDFYKVDSDIENELAAAFNIRSIPTLIFVPVDAQPQVASGAMSKAQFKELFQKVFNL